MATVPAMSTTVLCPDPDVDEIPRFVGEFDNASIAQMWLEIEHCNQLATAGGKWRASVLTAPHRMGTSIASERSPDERQARHVAADGRPE